MQDLESFGALGQIYDLLGRRDVFVRPVASDRDRVLMRVGALMGCGHTGALLNEALRDGVHGSVPAESLEDLLIHLATYTGMARAMEAMAQLIAIGADGGHTHDIAMTRAESAGLDFAGRFRHGIALYSLFDADRAAEQLAYYSRLSPEFYKYGMGLFGCTFDRPGLNIREREIATVAVLAAMGHCGKQLAFHTRVALDKGVESADLGEILIHVQLLAGLPVANNAAAVMIETLAASGASLQNKKE